MRCVAVASLESGVSLAQPVYNHQGDLMFGAGSIITEKEVRVLKSWGVENVWISKKTLGTSSSKEKDTASRPSDVLNGNTLEVAFSDVLDDPIMAEIMRVGKKIQERRYSKVKWTNDHR